MLEHFTPDDTQNDHTYYHKRATVQAQEPVDTADDKDFTVQEIRNAVTSISDNKAPGGDGITSETYKSTFEISRTYITAIYSGCLRRGVFPARWKRAKLIQLLNRERAQRRRF